MKNAWLNLTSLSQVSLIEKKLWIILFWITPIELDMALTQKSGLAWITSHDIIVWLATLAQGPIEFWQKI